MSYLANWKDEKNTVMGEFSHSKVVSNWKGYILTQTTLSTSWDWKWNSWSSVMDPCLCTHSRTWCSHVREHGLLPCIVPPWASVCLPKNGSTAGVLNWYRQSQQKCVFQTPKQSPPQASLNTTTTVKISHASHHPLWLHQSPEQTFHVSAVF